MTTMRIAFAADERYAIPLAASVRSVLDNADRPGELEIAIMSHGISEPTREKLAGSWSDAGASIRFVDTEHLGVAGLPTGSRLSHAGHLSAACYLRLFLPTLFPEWSRAIYIDADTITCADLTSLWEMPLHGRALAAVHDPWIPTVSSDDAVQRWKQLGLDPDAKYFNSGVLLLDLEAWREEKIAARCFEYIAEDPDAVVLFDQEALNAVIHGEFTELDQTWNLISYWHDPARRVGVNADILERAKIRHFVCQAYKPWLTTDRTLSGSDLFFHSLARTWWRDWTPSD